MLRTRPLTQTLFGFLILAGFLVQTAPAAAQFGFVGGDFKYPARAEATLLDLGRALDRVPADPQALRGRAKRLGKAGDA